MEELKLKTESERHPVEWQRINKIRSWTSIICALVIILTVVCELGFYQPHADAGQMLKIVLPVCAVLLVRIQILSIIGMFRYDSKSFLKTLLWNTAVMAVWYAAGWVMTKIPLCPMCEGITAEELGFLARWISAGP